MTGRLSKGVLGGKVAEFTGAKNGEDQIKSGERSSNGKMSNTCCSCT